MLYGGGRNARIQGYRVGGKSGTSQKLDSADEKARIASFVAVAPIDDPQFLCLVCLDEPHSWTTAGGSLSAPVCAEVLEQTLVYKGVPRAVEPETDTDPAQTAADLPPTVTALTVRKQKTAPERSSDFPGAAMFFCLILLRLLAEDDLAGLAVHGLHNGKALQLDALAADQLAALLEALFHSNADALHCGTGLLGQIQQAHQAQPLARKSSMISTWSSGVRNFLETITL